MLSHPVLGRINSGEKAIKLPTYTETVGNSVRWAVALLGDRGKDDLDI